MQAILAVTFPFFALVLLGYVAVQRGMLPESAIPGLNGFVLFFALPCMLFRFGSSMPLAQLLDPVLIAIYLGGALLMVLFTIALTLRQRPDGPGVTMKDAAFGALVAAFPNSGFMGFPLLIGLLGERVAGPLIGCILIDLVVTSSLCLALAQLRPASETATREALLPSIARAMRGAFSNPLPWAIALGALVAATGLPQPQAVKDIVRMLGDAATPVALFTIGAVLWRAQQHAHSRTPLRDYLPVALVKLLIHPLLMLAGGVLANAAGAEVSSFALLVLVLNAALPSASNVAILAERYGADNGRITRIIMASTALAFVTFSAIAWAFGVRRG
ncbi:MAG: AEC family transporter [Piscinibacter sp.]|uniref:AEC family transporter n=1 Tax=Piscinibacter TaxID=1114981 RepID=UPI000FDCEB8C|nr:MULTISPECIES: AEC family transporter [Piscinibacter]MCW5667741.1 AEC family transporter [Piscinibacter sp.]